MPGKRRVLLVGLAAGLCAVFGGARPAAARELITSIDLDYTYTQTDVGGDVNAAVQFNQKYEMRYTTALTTSYDFLGAVRLDLQDGWYTDKAHVGRIAPTLEMEAKGSQAAAKISYELSIGTTDAFEETEKKTAYSSNFTVDLEVTPELWPEIRLKYQRRRDYQAYTTESISNSVEFTARKDIYGLRLEYNFRREDIDKGLPEQIGSTETKWSGRASYKEILWGGMEFELGYEINETYKDELTRGVFTGETSSYNQLLKTRLRNSLVIGPRMTLGVSWEYQFEQDLLAVDFDYKLKNKYILDLRWDAYDWLKITSEARHETDLKAAVPGEDDERSSTDSFKTGFALNMISWLQFAGKAEYRSDGKVGALSGGSVDREDEDKYELIAKNRWGDFWDLTVDGISTTKHTDGILTNRETRVKTDLRLRLLDLIVQPSYEVSRINTWERNFDFPTSQQQVRDMKIRFEYQMQLLDNFKATFTHEYAYKVDDKLDEVLNFERITQFSEDTRLNVLLAEIMRDLRIEGEIDRKASDTTGDTDPELVEVSYALKLDYVFDRLGVTSTFKYNDKGNTWDDVSFNTRAGWKGDQLELLAEYQIDKIIKDITEPKDEKRKLNLRLNYKF